MKQLAAEGSLVREGLRVGALLTVLVVAHFAVRAQRAHGEHVGNVAYLDPWDARSFDGPSVAIEPSLIMIGDSQQAMVSSPKPNGLTVEGLGDTVLDGLAHGLDARYPSSTPRTYLRLAGSDFTPIEELAALGVWLNRAHARPVPVVIGIDLVASARRPRLQTATQEAIRPFPEAREELAASLTGLPEGAKAAKLISDLPPDNTPLSIDWFEAQLTKRSRQHNFYYGDPYASWLAPRARYETAEAPVLRFFFGAPPGSVGGAERPQSDQASFVVTLVRYLAARGMPAICYVEPRNPKLYPLSPETDAMVENLRTSTTDAGCVFIDAWRSLRGSENWGYLGGEVDETHITRAGHRALATFLLEEGEKAGAWRSLQGVTGGGSPP